MDFLNAGLDLVQSRLAWVATETFDWKLCLQLSSWGVCLFESYLLYALSSAFSLSCYSCDAGECSRCTPDRDRVRV